MTKSGESDEDVGEEERVVYSTEVISRLDNQSQRSFDIMHPRDDGKGQSNDPDATVVMRTDTRTQHTPAHLRRPESNRLGKYDDQGLIAKGAMGEVRRVFDPRFRRTLAMKIIHRDLLRYSDAIARFVEEAQACAQLEHSGIVPVHDVGQLPDGRYFYTMKEVRGRDLGHVIAKVHTASRDGIWRADESGWTFRKLVRAFETISLSMAFAHSKGVIHRDLKPGNVMLGSYQEVLIVDWGLVKVVGQPDSADFRTSSVLTDRSQDNAHATRIGDVAGTPAYMSPEQAEGQNDDLDYRSDIYALGAILYHILCNRAPFNGTGPDVVKQVATLDPVPVQLSKALRRRPELLERYKSTGDSAVFEAVHPEGVPLPEALCAICAKAMQRDPLERYQSAEELADDVAAWLYETI
ncbi:MAG: serine/threonine-protein kinase [Myxococcota bacterium]|nr:serine/threonine-protein kinase [Myxococcota bacterium]